MIIKTAADVPPDAVRMPGAKGVDIRLLIHQAEGAPNFYMRQFTLAPGGHTPEHAHDWEHEMYVLSGSGTALTPDGEREVRRGDCIYVAPNDRHQFRNTGAEALEFLCLIPKT
ncbi:MAG TPA: cupin domain-containing protein [Phycisphaerae bacterium]|nr:cupin domain-containing protein [Phycisphaerae bacterium]